MGFSPAELIFGHTIRGPLRLLREQLTGEYYPRQNVLDYVSSFRERLHHACALAKEALSSSKSKMKSHFESSFNPGNSVLIFLPIPGSALKAKFTGPYVTDKKLSETGSLVLSLFDPSTLPQLRFC